jgi:hypothetical protein
MGKNEISRLQTRRLQECCPICDHVEGVPLVWGDPNDKTYQAWRRGEVSLAGQLFKYREDGSLPEYECQACGHWW